jgi:hypothetical protein
MLPICIGPETGFQSVPRIASDLSRDQHHGMGATHHYHGLNRRGLKPGIGICHGERHGLDRCRCGGAGRKHRAVESQQRLPRTIVGQGHALAGNLIRVERRRDRGIRAVGVVRNGYAEHRGNDAGSVE